MNTKFDRLAYWSIRDFTTYKKWWVDHAHKSIQKLCVSTNNVYLQLKISVRNSCILTSKYVDIVFLLWCWMHRYRPVVCCKTYLMRMETTAVRHVHLLLALNAKFRSVEFEFLDKYLPSCVMHLHEQRSPMHLDADKRRHAELRGMNTCDRMDPCRLLSQQQFTSLLSSRCHGAQRSSRPHLCRWSLAFQVNNVAYTRTKFFLPFRYRIADTI